VVNDWQAYEDRAVMLALQPEQLRALRVRLRENLPTAALFAADRYCADFESGLQAIWDRHRAGLSPAAITL
jgi:predicted O-linked N-acetylglucosamine transferase (SPINDLY family)